MIPDNRDFLRREISSPYPFELDSSNDGVNLSVTSSSGRVALPGLGPFMVVMVANYGTSAAFIRFGDNTVVATKNSHCVLPGTQVALTLPTAVTYVAAITDTGTTSLQLSTGLGGV